MLAVTRTANSVTTQTVSWAVLPSFIVVELVALAVGWAIPNLVTGVLQPLGRTPAIFSGVAIWCIGLAFASIWQGRLILRAIPIRGDGQRCPASIAKIALALVAILAALRWGTWSGVDLRSFSLGALIFVTAPFTLALIRHFRPNTFRRRPFVLFLRRFSSFADQAGVFAVLKATESKVPVVFLLSPDTGLDYWDPFIVAFAGTSFRHPFRTAPVFLRSTDEQWQQDVMSLAMQARGIVVDITERSESMSREIDLARERETEIQVVWLRARTFLKRAGSQGETAELWPTLSQKKVEYSISWKRAVPRVLTGLIILYLSLAILLVVGQTGLFGIIFGAIVRLLTASLEIVALPSDIVSMASAFAAATVIVLPLWYFSFVKPSIGKESEVRVIGLVRAIGRDRKGPDMKTDEEASTRTTKPVFAQLGQFLRSIAALGVLMLGFSMILIFIGVSGAILHNVLQLGGLALMFIGGVGWSIASKRR